MLPRKSRALAVSKKQRTAIQKPPISVQERLQNTEKRALPAELQAVFGKYRSLFLKWAFPYTCQGIPLEVLHEYCILFSLTHWKNFDPNRGTRFATFITNGWKYALGNARRDFFQGTRIWQHLKLVTEKEEGALLQTVKSQEPTPDEKTAMAHEILRLRSALNQLPERERMIIALRFGIGAEAKTLEEVGTIFGVSKERVRQLQQKGLKILRQFLAGK